MTAITPKKQSLPYTGLALGFLGKLGTMGIALFMASCLPASLEPLFVKTSLPVKQEIPLWQNTSSSEFSATANHSGEVLSLQEAPARSGAVISAGADGKVILWDLTNGGGALLHQIQEPLQIAVLGRRHALVAWSSGISVSVACVTGCSSHWKLSRLRTRTTTLGFHEDDSSLIIGGADGRVYRWHFERDQLSQTQDERDRSLERYTAHQTMISAVLPLHTGRIFFSADWDGRLLAWLAYTADDHEGSYDRNLFGGRFFGGLGTYMFAPRPADRGITALAVSDNGQRLALGTDDGYVEIWEVRGLEMISRSLLHTGRVIGVGLTKDGSRIASLGRDGAVIVGDIAKNPSYAIAPGALRNITTEVFREEVKPARRISFLSTGNLLLSTNQGQLGEIGLSATPRAETPSPLKTIPGKNTTKRGSDY